MHGLISVIAKLDRAKEHLATFDSEFARFLELNPYRIEPHPPTPPPQLGEAYATPAVPNLSIGIFRIDHEPPLRLRLILGDYIHNARAALDHLFWQLCLLEDPAAEEFSYFPIFASSDPGSQARLKGVLQLVHPDVAIALERLQPYHRGDAYRFNKLWQLARLDNIDKHVTPILAVLREAIVAQWAFNAGDSSGTTRSVDMLRNPLNDGDQVFAIFPRTPPPIGPKDDETQIYVEPTYGVLIDDATGFSIPLDEVRRFHTIVENGVLPRFTRFFG
jgi:hypothetical protein